MQEARKTPGYLLQGVVNLCFVRTIYSLSFQELAVHLAGRPVILNCGTCKGLRSQNSARTCKVLDAGLSLYSISSFTSVRPSRLHILRYISVTPPAFSPNQQVFGIKSMKIKAEKSINSLVMYDVK